MDTTRSPHVPPGWWVRLTLGIVKIFCPRGESFTLSIVQIPTYAQERWGGALH